MKSLLSIALIVVLSDTGQTRDGLPVFVLHPQNAKIAAQLDRGVTGELLRVYRMLQVRRQRRNGTEIEPAYLLLSDRQGGFAKYGFWLGAQKKPQAAYVDIHRAWKVSGQFGAIDQIFPHELTHAILHLLGISAPPGGGGNQVHALTVRTDRFTAFNEGLAEHVQIMAVDHPGAAPETRALANAHDREAAAWKHLAAYRSEMTAHFAPAARMRMGFPLWYSNDERVLRYFAVKENRFVREVRVPAALLTAADPERAYLLENVLPGDPDGAVKAVPRLIDSEGAVSAFFHRWATDQALQQRRRDEAFYEQFGTDAAAVSPLQNLYLKLFSAAEARRTADVASLVGAYREMFPDEASLVDGVVFDSFMGQPLTAPPEIWLANSGFTTGTTLFDQFRGLPRTHTFDLNAASVVDLVSVPGITPELARSIMKAGPYSSVDAVGRVPGVSADLVSRMKAMAAGMRRLAEADEEGLTLRPILMPYLWRALIVLLIAALAGAVVYRLARIRAGVRPSLTRTAISALAGALLGMLAHWVSGSALAGVAAVVIAFGIPAGLWQLYKTRRLAPALIAPAIWGATALPAVMMTSAL